MRLSRIRLSACTFAALILGAAATQAPQGALAAPSRPAATSIAGQLTGVTATSGTSAWAAGYQNTASGGDRTLLLHWDGTAWSQVTSPNPSPSQNELLAVTSTSDTGAWAVGRYYSSKTGMRTLILHWDGTTWSKVTSPNPGSDNELWGVTATSATDAWAAGYYFTSTGGGNVSHTLILHWNGTTWSRVPAPNPSPGKNFLDGVSAESGTDAWAAGYYFTGTGTSSVSHTLLLHWNGTGWSRVSSPDPSATENVPYAVHSTTATSAWAAGLYYRASSGSYGLLALHWNGTTWAQTGTPSPGNYDRQLTGLTATSDTDAWAVGYDGNTNGGDNTLILHWNGTTWTQVPSPDPSPSTNPDENQLAGVAATSSTNAWAVGVYFTSSSTGWVSHALILRWDGTAWSMA